MRDLPLWELAGGSNDARERIALKLNGVIEPGTYLEQGPVRTQGLEVHMEGSATRLGPG